ncbi:MAG: lamin tail domain-containing protein [Spirochaetaceae bacterium]|nr:lamin tail domain-containing protein [Spirochaetaceae bacterium]MDE0221221.1 lamin tail domain-containing protein [Spirochaetaceae bacterium]
MEQLLSLRSLFAVLAAAAAAASLSGCMEFLETSATQDPPGAGAAAVAPDAPDPDVPRPPAAPLVINEVDYDQKGADDAEFMEIVNPNPSAVDLADYRIELINGSNGRRYGSYAPTGRLDAGAYLVIGDQAVIDAAAVGTVTLPLKSGGLQNGPDAVRIVEAATGRVLDGVHYRDAVPGFGEGAPAPRDDTSSPTSIGRCPDGFDSDDNGADFGTMTPSPGAANACAGLISGEPVSG